MREDFADYLGTAMAFDDAFGRPPYLVNGKGSRR